MGQSAREGEGGEILMAVRKLSRGRAYAFDRALIEMAKTMDLNEIAKNTGRVPAGILRTALRLDISIKERKAEGK